MEGANYKIDPMEIIVGLVKNPIVYLKALGGVSELEMNGLYDSFPGLGCKINLNVRGGVPVVFIR